MRIIRAALAAFVVALAVSAAGAQSGGLTVQVLDENGDPLPGATVTLSHETGYVKTTAELTDRSGVVEFPVLRPGSGYAVEVSFPGMSTIAQSDVRVKIGENQTVPFQLSPEMKERVVVEARSDVVDLDQPQASTKFSDDFISDLPVAGRLYQNVLTLAPAVQDADGDGNPNVRGSRDRDFKAIVGGVSNVDPLTGQYMSRVNPNSIEEMEVITAGAGVEFGRAQGGFTRIIQKQGSNEHEFVFDLIYQTGFLDGDGAGDDSNLPDDTDFESITPGFLLSGPVIQDKLWYVLAHELRNLEDPVNVSSGLVVREFDEATHFDKLTWQVSPRNQLAFQYNSDPAEVRGVNISSFVPLESSISAERTGDQFGITWAAPYSPKVLVNTTVAWQDLNTRRYPTVVGSPPDCVEETGAQFLGNGRCFDANSGQVSGSHHETLDDHSQRLTAKSDVTLFGGKFWGMSHTFKFGMSVENERYFRHQELRPRATFFVVTDPGSQGDGQGETDPERFGRIFTTVSNIPESGQDVRTAGTVFGVYAQDQFKPRPNLTMELGLRLDREEIASDGKEPLDPQSEFNEYLAYIEENGGIANIGQLQANELNNLRAQLFTVYEETDEFIGFIANQVCLGNLNCINTISNSALAQAISFGQKRRRDQTLEITNTNLSPFLSVGWDPWNNGKTAFKASVGRYYNNIPLTIPLEELEPAFATIDQRFSVPCPGGVDCIEGDSQIEPQVNISVVDRGLKTPYQDEFHLRFEREIFTETRISVQYTNRKYLDQFQDRNVNLATGDYGHCVFQAAVGGPTIDTSQGPDGLLDDCVGEVERVLPSEQPGGGGSFPGGDEEVLLQRPDGIPDLYTLNPLWGDIYLIGNFNEADYEDFVVEVVRRQYRSWEMSGSYTWSKLFGDGEDYEQVIGDDPSLRTDEEGYQSNDQRHVVKLNAATVTPWGIRLGSAVSWQSGLPFSLLRQAFAFDAIPPLRLLSINDRLRFRNAYTTGVRNDQRNASYWNVDLKATKEMNLGRGMNLQVSAEIFNLLNDDTYTVYNTGSKIGQQVNGQNEAYRRFGRSWQLGMKLAF